MAVLALDGGLAIEFLQVTHAAEAVKTWGGGDCMKQSDVIGRFPCVDGALGYMGACVDGRASCFGVSSIPQSSSLFV